MAFMSLYIQDARCGRLNVGCVGVVGKGREEGVWLADKKTDCASVSAESGFGKAVLLLLENNVDGRMGWVISDSGGGDNS
jgi:hypothetical protein